VSDEGGWIPVRVAGREGFIPTSTGVLCHFEFYRDDEVVLRFGALPAVPQIGATLDADGFRWVVQRVTYQIDRPEVVVQLHLVFPGHPPI
jgi:hypothetical protein